MSTSTISNTLTDASGNPVEGARVVARLMPSPAFRTSDSSEIQPIVETVTNGSGQWSLVLEETANITPADSHYEIVEYQDDRPRRHAIQVAATDQSLLAALVTPPPPADGATYITQASGDARYQQLGGGFGSVSSVGTANAAGVSSAAARADHVHDIANGAIDAVGLFVAALRPIVVCTTAGRPGSPSVGDPIYDTDVDGILVWASATAGWQKPWNMPWGLIGYAERTSDTGNITAIADLTLSVALPASWPANRIVRVEARSTARANGAAAQANLYIREGATVLGTIGTETLAASGQQSSLSAEWIGSPTAGAHTIKASGEASTNTIFMGSAAATGASVPGPQRLAVYDVGPNAAPA